MSRPSISVVVITYNEEHNIDDCLQSAHGWADEIVVVDDESTDRTQTLAQKYTDKVFVRKMDNEGRHRNWAYAQASTDWVISLDADERLTDELKQEIDGVLNAGTEHSLFNIPRKNYIGNYWLQHGGQYPSAQCRLFKKGAFKYEEVHVHPRAFKEGTTGNLKGDIIHYSYRDFGHFLQKLNGQTTLEAQKMVQSGRKILFLKWYWRSVDRFFRYYIGKQGYKDGFYGFMGAVFASLYQTISYAKYWEMKNRGK